MRAQIVWLTTASVAVGCLALRGTPDHARTPTSFDRVTVHRLDVVEPDGKPRVIASSSAAYPGAIFGGKELPHPDRQRLGGFLFFNDDATEAGGWGYANKSPDGTNAPGAILTMDQYNQNETLELTYEDGGGARGAGLVVFGDHPAQSLEPVFAAEAELRSATSEPAKAAAKAKLAALADTASGKQVKRMFVGRMADDAQVTIADLDDTPRIMLKVDGAGEPSIVFFDGKGQPVKTITGH